MLSVTELFCHVDDFCLQVEPQWQQQLLTDGLRRRQRAGQMTNSEIMTLLIHFHQARYRDFKTYYTHYVQRHLRAEFPDLVSYGRMVQLMPRLIWLLCVYLFAGFGRCTGLSFVDSTALAVCHNRRISRHKVFAGSAQRGKTSMGWFFGFKLHFVVNECGELLAVCLTAGNRHDLKVLPRLVKRLFGRLFGDKAYLSRAMTTQLAEQGVQLITKLRANMKDTLQRLDEALLLRKRAIIETIVDQLKNISQIEHTRHRSPLNFLVNLLCGLIAYCHQPKKPSLRLPEERGLPEIIHN